MRNSNDILKQSLIFLKNNFWKKDGVIYKSLDKFTLRLELKFEYFGLFIDLNSLFYISKTHATLN